MEYQSRSLPPTDVSKPSMFAFIIGINTYPKLRPLQGAVPDAESMADYLANDLKVPEDHITKLYNEQATRDAIISGFIKLRDNSKIQKQDAIIIFFAGHGSELSAPDGWETGGAKIQAIVPWDAETSDSTGSSIEVIPDRTIATLLNDIAKDRGDNITVIFDCCHASSGTRTSIPPDGYLVRSIDEEELSPLSPDVDSSILGGRSSVIPAGFERRELRSHVLLAACGARERAREHLGQGDFTTKLLEVLRGTDITRLSYSGLMQNFPPLDPERKQNPQCEGYNVNRILFNSILPGANSAFIPTEIINQRIILKAGVAQGICPGDIFEIHHNHILDPSPVPPIATLEADRLQAYQATLFSLDGTLPEVPERAWAIRIDSTRDLRVNCSPQLDQRLDADSLWHAQFHAADGDRRIRLVDPSEAQISIGLDSKGENVWFETHHPIVVSNGMQRLPHTVPAQANRVLAVLRAAAMWNHHLDRENTLHHFRSRICMEFFSVKPRPAHYDPHTGRDPTERTGTNLNNDEPIHVVGDRHKYYGMNIINLSDRELYPYLFYFDASTFAIEPKFLVHSSGAGQPDAPLPPGGTLALGHGPGGTVPFAYHVGGTQELDVGILKLFVTDTPVAFGCIEQDDSVFAKEPRTVKRGGQASMKALWDTSSIVLVQSRPY